MLKESCLKYGIEPAPDPLESSLKEYSENKKQDKVEELIEEVD